MTDWAREAVEERTRSWLDAGGRPQRMTPYDFQELQRRVEIFRWFDRFEFGSFLDVGSGFDVFPQLVARRYGVPAYYADLVHSIITPTQSGHSAQGMTWRL